MEVDVERQRIGLSLRLDDEPGQPAPKRRGDGPRGSAKPGGRGERKRSGHKSSGGSRGGSRGRTGGPGGAMADALKKAGF